MNEELMEVFARDETCVSWGYLSLQTMFVCYGSSIIVVAVGKGILLVRLFSVSPHFVHLPIRIRGSLQH